MLAYLYCRYGTESSVFQSMLQEILNLPHPKNEKEEEVNLAKISALTSISTTESNRDLYTMERVRELVNNTLTDTSRETFWDKFLDCKSELRGVTPLEEWDLKYEQEFSSHRLEFLNAFINRRLEVLRNISSN